MKILAKIAQILKAISLYVINVYAEQGLNDEKVPYPVNKRK